MRGYRRTPDHSKSLWLMSKQCDELGTKRATNIGTGKDSGVQNWDGVRTPCGCEASWAWLLKSQWGRRKKSKTSGTTCSSLERGIDKTGKCAGDSTRTSGLLYPRGVSPGTYFDSEHHPRDCEYDWMRRARESAHRVRRRRDNKTPCRDHQMRKWRRDTNLIRKASG